jgi:light-regulated signal transduction histidine kinase (bacteriophytochrome)
MDQIRVECAAIQQATYDASGRQSEKARSFANLTALIAVAGSVIMLTLLVFAMVSIERGTRRRASHDLQEPTRTARIFSQLLTTRFREKFDGQALDFLENVSAATNRMEMLLRDLLAYTHVAQLEMVAEHIDAQRVIESVLDSIAASATESGAQITFDSMPQVSVPAVHCQQLFQNLIGNAIKYRANGHQPVVHIGVHRQDGFWRFSIKDDGIGIDPEDKDRIFGLFKRLHTADQYSGTGIGLALCKRIVELHGGSIWVESEPGKGSTFYFTLPGPAAKVVVSV